MAIFDTRSLGSYAFTDRPIGAEFENNLSGFVDPTSRTVLLAVVITYPYTITNDECNVVSFPNVGVSDVLAYNANLGIGLEGVVTELPGAADRVDFTCTDYSDDVMGYDTQTVTVSGELELR